MLPTSNGDKQHTTKRQREISYEVGDLVMKRNRVLS